MVVFNSPSNPPERWSPKPTCGGWRPLAERHDLWVMADEIYRRICYGVDSPSIAALPRMLERTILVDGFSKTYAMTGWRLGGASSRGARSAAVRLGDQLEHLHRFFVQEAGIAALRGPQDVVDAMVAQFRARRDAIVARLARDPGRSLSRACPAPSMPFPTCAPSSRRGRARGSAAAGGSGRAARWSGLRSGGSGYLRLSFRSFAGELEEAADRSRALVAGLADSQAASAAAAAARAA